jgi:hypothetical protein
MFIYSLTLWEEPEMVEIKSEYEYGCLIIIIICFPYWNKVYGENKSHYVGGLFYYTSILWVDYD